MARVRGGGGGGRRGGGGGRGGGRGGRAPYGGTLLTRNQSHASNRAYDVSVFF